MELAVDLEFEELIAVEPMGVLIAHFEETHERGHRSRSCRGHRLSRVGRNLRHLLLWRHFFLFFHLNFIRTLRTELN